MTISVIVAKEAARHFGTKSHKTTKAVTVTAISGKPTNWCFLQKPTSVLEKVAGRPIRAELFAGQRLLKAAGHGWIVFDNEDQEDGFIASKTGDQSWLNHALAKGEDYGFEERQTDALNRQPSTMRATGRGERLF
jgi:hypothetical protein